MVATISGCKIRFDFISQRNGKACSAQSDRQPSGTCKKFYGNWRIIAHIPSVSSKDGTGSKNRHRK